MAVEAVTLGFPLVPCPFCEAERGTVYLKRVDPFRNPECFWLADSYWRHVHEQHPLACGSAGERIPAYLRLELAPDDEFRLMLHLGECKECHEQILKTINSGMFLPPWPRGG